MGASQSGDDRDIGDAFTLQQQRAQMRMLQQQLQQETRDRNNEALRPLALALAGGGQALRPADQPGLRMSRIFKNPAHLQSKTLGLGKKDLALDGEKPALPSVSFTFDATFPGTMNFYWGSVCSLDAAGGWVVKSAQWKATAKFESGLRQEFKMDWLGATEMPEADVTEASRRIVSVWQDTDDWGTGLFSWPLLVELRVDSLPEDVKEDSEVSTPCVEWTMIRVIDLPGLPESAAEVIGQKIVCADAPALDIQEVYGSEVSNDCSSRQECIVCQCEPRDTMVLPCRHMCLCSTCSEFIRTRIQYHSFKCPICRKRIGRMMRVDSQSTSGVTWADQGAAFNVNMESGGSTPITNQR